MKSCHTARISSYHLGYRVFVNTLSAWSALQTLSLTVVTNQICCVFICSFIQKIRATLILPPCSHTMPPAYYTIIETQTIQQEAESGKKHIMNEAYKGFTKKNYLSLSFHSVFQNAQVKHIFLETLRTEKRSHWCQVLYQTGELNQVQMSQETHQLHHHGCCYSSHMFSFIMI